MLSRVYIQRRDGEIRHESCFTAWLGLGEKGYEVSFFEGPDLTGGRLPLARTTLVVGSVANVESAWRQLGVAVPPPLNLPERLSGYRGRRVWSDTLGEVRRKFRQGHQPPLFVKPRTGTKTFHGHLLFDPACLAFTRSFPDDMELEVSEYVHFASEWRCFVHRQKVVGLAHYHGDCCRYPCPDTLRAAVRDYAEEAPVAYALDVGVAGDGRTLLVEVNDAYALGSYGLRPALYADLLEDRWLELVGLNPGPGKIEPWG